MGINSSPAAASSAALIKTLIGESEATKRLATARKLANKVMYPGFISLRCHQCITVLICALCSQAVEM